MEDQKSHISHFIVNCNGDYPPPWKDYIKEIDSSVLKKLPVGAKRKARYVSNQLLRAFIKHKGLTEEEMEIPIDEWWLFLQDFERKFKSDILEESDSRLINSYKFPFAKDREINMLFELPPKKCLLCERNPNVVTFIPCGHKYFCKECFSLLGEEIDGDLNCLECHNPIEACTVSNRPDEILSSFWEQSRTRNCVDDNDIPIVP